MVPVALAVHTLPVVSLYSRIYVLLGFVAANPVSQVALLNILVSVVVDRKAVFELGIFKTKVLTTPETVVFISSKLTKKELPSCV